MRAQHTIRGAAMLVLVALATPACGGATHSSGSDPTDSAQPSPSPAATSPAATTPEPTPAPTGAGPTTSAPSAGSVITDVVVDNPAFDSLQERIIDVVESADLPGASLLVVHDGTVVEQEAWGEYDLATRVPIASGSKWLSAATIMTVVEDGDLALDEPVSSYIPELAGAPAGQITLRHLLTFTSGLRSDQSDPCTEDAGVDLVTCVRRIVAAGLRHPPGAEFRYDGVHLMVAAALAEVVTGVPFAELFLQRIAQPLGMTETAFFQVGDPQRTPVGHPNPAAGAISTLGDYGRFLEMIVNGGVAPDGTRILTEATIAEMETNQTEGLPVYGSSFRRNTRAPYGLGHWIDWTAPDGSTLVSSSPGTFGFRPWIDWKNHVFGVYLVYDTIDRSDPAFGDPDRPSAGGQWIIEMSAEAVGGSLPTEFYGHRS